MRYLIFTNTPAHVHLYKHVVRELHDRGHTVKILARDYGCTTDLLKFYDLPHAICGRCGTTKVSLFALLPSHYIRIIQHAMDFDPDLIFGMGAYSARAGAVTRTPTILVLDSEPTGLDHRLSRPFADAILTPSAFRKDLGWTRGIISGEMELLSRPFGSFRIDAQVGIPLPPGIVLRTPRCEDLATLNRFS